VIEIVDIDQAREHLWAFAAAPLGVGTEAAKAWAAPLHDALETEGVSCVLAAMATCEEDRAIDPEGARKHHQ
jgi:hypothetical protein